MHHATLRQHYKAFFDWLERPELFKTAKRGRLEYADVFPLIYLRMRLEGVSSCWSHVKHLLIDEMQDYTPVQYAVIAQLFNCRMTILGDGHQSVNPYSGSSSEEIRQAFQSALRVTLNKSFRSSYEIARFAQRIQPNPDLEIIERHGKEPEVIRCKNRTEENETLGIQAQQFNESDYNTLGVICKTQKQASQLYDFLSERFRNLYLLSEDSRTFRAGIVICTAHMAKGLEFDQVIVPHATDRNYHNSMDRNLLYVACTRAIHKLTLTHTGQPSGFIEAE